MDFTLSSNLRHKLSQADRARFYIIQFYKRHPYLSKGLIVLALISSLIASSWNSKEVEPKNKYQIPVDTFIPKGFVLIPMKIENYENLDSILGKKGIVNIFSKSDEDTEPKQIATSVRVLRAPNSPEKLSILSPADSAHRFIHPNQKYWVVIQGQTQLGTKIVDRQEKVKKRTIRYLEGG